MFIDLATSTRKELDACDVAIVGAGAAGITLALELEASGLSVAILEGGQGAWTELSQNRYQGEVSTGEGFSYPALDRWRLRYFGGTTNHWVGWCRRLEENVFTQRSNGLGEGWPFQRSDLEPDYQRAMELCTLGRDLFDAETLTTDADLPVLVKATDVLATPVWRFPKQLRFASYYRSRLSESPIKIYFGANCMGFTFEGKTSSPRASLVHIKNENGLDFELSAKFFVLASGGIENVRQLLLAAQSQKQINRSGNLGLGFLEHPHGAVGAVLCGDHTPEDLAGVIGYPKDIDGTQFKVGVGLNEEVSAERGMINTSFTLEPLQTIPREALHGDAIQNLWQSTQPTALGGTGSQVIGIYARTEQRWNSASRVSLISAKDDLGAVRARLDWRVLAQDVADIRTSLGLVGGELLKAGFGPMTFGDPISFQTMEGGGHHLGGARMHISADQGVVNENSQCHGIDNLYAVGGSSFPTAGFSNPTLTIVALAVRLARTLRERM